MTEQGNMSKSSNNNRQQDNMSGRLNNKTQHEAMSERPNNKTQDEDMSESFLWQPLSQHRCIHQDPLHLLRPPLFLRKPWCQSAAAHEQTMKSVDHWVSTQSAIWSMRHISRRDSSTQNRPCRIWLGRSSSLGSQSSRGRLCTNRRIYRRPHLFLSSNISTLVR